MTGPLGTGIGYSIDLAELDKSRRVVVIDEEHVTEALLSELRASLGAVDVYIRDEMGRYIKLLSEALSDFSVEVGRSVQSIHNFTPLTMELKSSWDESPHVRDGEGKKHRLQLEAGRVIAPVHTMTRQQRRAAERKKA